MGCEVAFQTGGAIVFMPSSADHDKLPYRLTQILRRLNEGQTLNAQGLADEFKVNLRTIQRDLNERFSFLPLERTVGGLRLNPKYLGKLNFQDIERFACLAGIQHLYPVLSTDFLRDLLEGRLDSALLVKGHQYEDLGDKTALFKQLERAILRHERVSFVYSKPEGEKAYDGIEPYKLINHSGVWYLACMDGDRLKAFSVTKIDRLLILDSAFDPVPHIEKLLQEEDSIWLNQQKSEVVLKVAKEAAGYFRRRKLISGQVLEKELEDGGIIISGKIAHPDQILPIVRYWIPSVQVVSPEGMQARLERQLLSYVEAKQ